MDGDLYGYWSGSSTCNLQVPFSKGAKKDRVLTLCRSLKNDMKFLHVVVDERHLIVTHQAKKEKGRTAS